MPILLRSRKKEKKKGLRGGRGREREKGWNIGLTILNYRKFDIEGLNDMRCAPRDIIIALQNFVIIANYNVLKRITLSERNILIIDIFDTIIKRNRARLKE